MSWKDSIERIKSNLISALNEDSHEKMVIARDKYHQLINELASKAKYTAIQECTADILDTFKIDHLISRKNTISNENFEIALSLINIETKRITKAPLENSNTPTKTQSLLIARAIINDETKDFYIASVMEYFAEIGHYKAYAELFDGHISRAPLATFLTLNKIQHQKPLSQTIQKLLIKHASFFPGIAESVSKFWDGTMPGNIFSLSLIEAIHGMGLKNEAFMLLEAYAASMHKGFFDKDYLACKRMTALGYDCSKLVKHAKDEFDEYLSSSNFWLEANITNPNISKNEISKELESVKFMPRIAAQAFNVSFFILKYIEEGRLELSQSDEILDKAATCISAAIDGVKTKSPDAWIKTMLEEYKLPNSFTLRVPELRGTILENDLGL